MTARTPTIVPVALLMSVWIPQIVSGQSPEPTDAGSYERDAALQHSQAAIGNPLGDYRLTDRHGKTVRLTDYAGKPLLISLVYTSCYHTCPVTTRYLAKAVAKAKKTLGKDSFAVATIGFDSAHDTPQSMRVFAREQDVVMPGWQFLSGSGETIKKLVDDLGFIYFPSPRGYDHIVQVSVIDRDSTVYAQVYGEAFELPWLVEPLKELVLNRPQSAGHPISGLLDRIRIFCTVYDPNTGRYRIDYSLFIQIAIGLIIVLTVGTYLLTETRRARRRQ
ncbi:MAG: SCO family protein [Gammaproteobacteria bacterium]|nr:SCO family protein [Gammaproteobacteria bacterium]MDH3767864.1 SCO family protein [Gammaproteobacteria bacterium]